jgi:cell division protein FtsW
MSARTTTVKGSKQAASDARAAKRRHPASLADGPTKGRTQGKAPAKSSAKPAAKGRRPPVPLHAYFLAVVVAMLTLLGLVMVLSASSVTALVVDGTSWTYFRRQALWMALGAVALFVTLRVPYNAWRRLVPTFLGVSLALMSVVLIPSIGREVNGARSWLALGPIGFQPSEMLKLALLLYAADLLARRADRMNEVRVTFVPLLLVLGISVVLTLLEPDLGGGMVLASIVLGVAFVAGAPLLPLGAAMAGVGAGGAMFMLKVRSERWTAFLDLAAHKQDDGFQVWQSLVGIATGGLTGVGLGASKAKWGYLPEAHTDFIFAIIAEELGLAGVAVVLALFLAFVWLGVRVALRARDRFGMLLAGGITAWILCQTIINIGGVVGLMPLTGLTLPFVSFGGSSLLVTMAAAGLLLNVARASR